MATSGFEGFEKRLELHFSGDVDRPVTMKTMGLRSISFDTLEQVLHAVHCSVVSALANRYFDAYVLSESSLFVYPMKIIIKTCGTTQILKSLLPLVAHASDLGLVPRACRYTRGGFIFPEAQPFPHTSFQDEVAYLEGCLPDNLCYRKASVMHSNVASHSWHVFNACDPSHALVHRSSTMDVISSSFTVEVCMTELDRGRACKFYVPPCTGRSTGRSTGKEMTDATGIAGINPRALICDFAFDPCGYSMNGIDGERYSTIHVTPEEGFSYASYECIGSIYDEQDDIGKMLRKVVQVFGPGTVSVSITGASRKVWTRVANALESAGLRCRSCAMDDFPEAGIVTFQTFTSRRK